MNVENLISDEIPPLRTSDSGLKALTWMEEFKVRHLAVVNHVDFLGTISEDAIYNLNSPNAPIGDFALELEKSFVYKGQHFYDVVKLAAAQKLSIVPVLDDADKYLGCITLPDMIATFADLLKEEGAVFVLKINARDYNFSQLARIIEDNNVKILSSYVQNIPDSSAVLLTVKLNTIDATAVINALNRFNYKIVNLYYQGHTQNPDYKNRLDLLMNYLDM